MVCPHCGAEFEPRRRSGRSNRYLWSGVYGPIARHLGYTPEQLHDALKDKFLGRDDLSTGLRIRESTAKLDQDRFSLYVDEVRTWAHQFLGLYIESPDEWREVA